MTKKENYMQMLSVDALGGLSFFTESTVLWLKEMVNNGKVWAPISHSLDGMINLHLVNLKM